MPVISKSQADAKGYPRGKYFLQTILIDKSFTKPEAIHWLKKHKYRYDDYRETTNFHRFMQTNPVRGSEYYTDQIFGSIDLVYQKYI